MKRKAAQMKWEDAVPRIHKCLISTVQLTQSHINELPLKAWIGANIYTAWYLDMPKFLLVVTESMLQQWNTEDRVSILDIEEAAAKNDADAFFICKLSELIGKPGPIDPPIYVISRKNGLMGAVGILNKAVQAKLQELFPDGYYILPCSIHHVIAVPSDMLDIDYLAKMVRDFNLKDINNPDRLSNHVFAIRHGRLTVVA